MSRSPVTVARETAPDLHRLPYSAYLRPPNENRVIAIDVVYATNICIVNSAEKRLGNLGGMLGGLFGHHQDKQDNQH